MMKAVTLLASTFSISQTVGLVSSKPVAFPFDGVNRINYLPGLPKAPGLQPYDITFKLKIPKKSDKSKSSKTSDRANEKEESELEKKLKEWQRKERSEGLVPIPKVQKIDLPSMNLPDRESVAVHHPEIVSDSEPIVKSVPTFSKKSFLMMPEFQSVGGWLQPRLLRPVVTANSTNKPTVTKSITEESVAPLPSAKEVVTPIVHADAVSNDTASGCWYYRRPEAQSHTVFANLPKSKTHSFATESDAPLPLKSITTKDESYTSVHTSDHAHPRCPESSATGCMPFMHNWWKKIGNFFHSKYQKAGAYIRKQKQRWSDYRSSKKHEESEVSYVPNDIIKVTAYPGPVSEKFDDAKSDFTVSTISTYAPQSGRSEASFDSSPNTDGSDIDSEKSFLVLDDLPYKPTSIRTLGPISITSKIQSELILPSALKLSEKIKSTTPVDDQTLPIQSQKTIIPSQSLKTILPPKYSLIVPEFVNQLNISNKKLQAFRELKKNVKSELDYFSFKKREIDNLSSSATNKYVNRMVQFVRIGREMSRAQNDYNILEKLIKDELYLKQTNIEDFRKNVSDHEYKKIQWDTNSFDKIMDDSDHEDIFKSRLENETDLIYDWVKYGLSRGHVILDHGKKDSILSTVEKFKEQDSKPDHTVSIKSESDPKKEESDTKVTKSWNDFKVNADIAIESFTNNEINRWKKLMSPSDLDGINEIKLLLNIKFDKKKTDKIIKENFFTDLKVESNIESRWNSFKESWKALKKNQNWYNDFGMMDGLSNEIAEYDYIGLN